MRREKHKLLFYPNLTGAAGAARAKPSEMELELDTKGSVAGMPDSGVYQSRNSSAKSWPRSPQCQECMVKQVFRYMSGRRIRRPTGRC